MANVPGVNGITGFVISRPEAPPFEVHGGPADPYHANRGEMASPYPWEVVPMGPYPGLMQPIDGMVGEVPGNASLPAGYMAQDPTADQTPAYNAAPFPNEGPGSKTAEQLDVAGRAEGSTRQLLQSASIHASNLGASLKRLFLPQMLARQDSWTGFFNPEPGNDLVPKIPGSVSAAAFGVGVNDRTSNAYAKRNGYGFDTAHRHRRYATGSVPGNQMWMKPGGRPMVRTLTGQYNFPVSGAFANDDPGASFGYLGAVLQNVPSEYVTPPQPNLAPNNVGTTGASETVPNIALY